MIDTTLLTSAAIAILLWGVASLILNFASKRDMFKLFSAALLLLLFNSFALFALAEAVFFPTLFGSGTIVSAVLTLVGVVVFFFLQFTGSFMVTEIIGGLRYSEQVHRARKQNAPPSRTRRSRFSRPTRDSLSFGRWSFTGLQRETDESETEKQD